jgi:hypothetical protein
MVNFIPRHWRKLRAKILPRNDRNDRISILGIPNELLLLIFNNLEIVDKACLALSCWTLYYKIGPLVLDHHNLLSLLTIASNDQHRIPPRTELLRRLEKDYHKRWLYCTACYTLHPRSEFSRLGTCGPIWKLGVVDLCPCIQLTFRQKVKLIRYLKALSQNTDHENTSQNSIMHGRLRAFKVEEGNEGGPINLSHECSISGHLLEIIKIKMNAYLTDEDHLVVETNYEVLGSRPLSRIGTLDSGCFHFGSNGQLRSGWIRLWDRPREHREGDCFFCWFIMNIYKDPERRGPYHETGQCKQNFGGSTELGRGWWHFQCTM